MRNPSYSYFLGFRPDAWMCRELSELARRAGQDARRVQEHLLHLTLCVIAEKAEPNPFVQRQVRAALAGEVFHSAPIPLGRVSGGKGGAAARTVGRQDALQDFYRRLVRLLGLRGIEPLHRASGLHPHATLGYDPCLFEAFGIALEWFPHELLLIESHVGFGEHKVIDRWPLLAPRQGFLSFEDFLRAG